MIDDTPNRFAPPTAHVEDVTTLQVSPPLWNPGAATSWSLLFSPIFGALVQMKNWQALGETAQAAASKRWAWISVAVMLVLVPASVFTPDTKGFDTLFRGVGFAYLLGWYYANGKRQVAFVKQRFGKTYPRRGWAAPLALAVLGFVGFMVVAVAIGAAGAGLFGAPVEA